MSCEAIGQSRQEFWFPVGGVAKVWGTSSLYRECWDGGRATLAVSAEQRDAGEPWSPIAPQQSFIKLESCSKLD
jgi:hypothetical protein